MELIGRLTDWYLLASDRQAYYMNTTLHSHSLQYRRLVLPHNCFHFCSLLPIKLDTDNDQMTHSTRFPTIVSARSRVFQDT